MPPHQPAVRERSALKAWWAASPAATNFDLTFQRIEGRADLAYVRGSYTMTLQPEGAPAPVTDRGKYLDIRRRQPDGAWLVELSTFNSSLA
jgi:ketosteroid isomerase-like protein